MRSSIPVLALLVIGCTPSWHVYTRSEPPATFHYQTFAIGSADVAPDGYRRAPVAAALLPLVTQTATTILQQKGYRQASGDACDLLVSVGVGQRQAQPEASQEQDATGSQVAAADPDGPFNYSVRELVIDVFDAKTRKRIFHGTARELMSGSSGEAPVRGALQALLDKLPGPTTMSATAAAAPSAGTPAAR